MTMTTRMLAQEDCTKNNGGKRKKKKKDEKKDEPRIKWKRSKAKKLLYDDIQEGRVPGEAKDANGNRTANLKDIYDQRPEFALYLYSKFSARLSSLWKTIKERNNGTRLDQEAFDNIISNHSVAFFHTKATFNGNILRHKSY